MSALAGYVRERMKGFGLSQSQLASKAGITESTLSNLLNKPGVLPRPETLRGLAKALETEEATLTALAGYAVDTTTGDINSRTLRFARLMENLPWLEAGVEKWLQLPEDEQDDILAQIEFRLSRQKGQS